MANRWIGGVNYTDLGDGTFSSDSGKLYRPDEDNFQGVTDPNTGFQAFAPGFSAPDSYGAVSRARDITNDPRLGMVMGTRGDDNEYYAYSRPSYDDNGNLVGGSPRPSYDDNGNLTSGIRPPSYDDNGNVVGAIQPTPASMNYNGEPLIRYDPDYWTKEMFYGGLDSLEPYRQQGLNNIVKIDGQYYVPQAAYDQSQAAMFPYARHPSSFDNFMEGLFSNGPLIAAAAFLGPAIFGGLGAAGAAGAGLAEGTAAGLAGVGESIMAGGYGANLAASGAGFGAGATGLSLAELGAGSLLGGGAGSVLAGGAGALGLSAETVAAMQALGYSGAEIASMGGNVLNGFDAMQAAASGAGLGTAAEVVNDGTWMEDLLGPPQSPAPPSSLMQQLVDAGIPFDIAKYLPSEASLVKTLIQQGLKLANSDGSGSSRPQAGGLPNYSGGSTNSGGDSSSGGVSGSFGNPFPDAPTGGASPIKAYLQPTGVSTGAPSQSTMYAGLDPKLVNILSQRAAHGGQIHPRLQQVLSDRGYEINPVEMVAGPEDRYYARHAKRGFAVNGKGTGQSDDIPTMLADGEYVFDSDTVSALGDGSSKAGAAALDKMREEIRKHKRSAPVDKIPPKAKSPLDYMRTVKRVK